MRIQELERLVGIERATIRFYEKEGLIHPARSENGYRDYSEADAEELKRIKLLRELGVTLETIRELQAGTADFRDVMQKQSVILAGRAQQMDRARAVCQRISADGVRYDELDTVRYQSLLEATQLPSPAWQGSGGAVYSENVPREVHPWRRFFARLLDHLFVNILLWCLIVVVLRWRPAYTLLARVISYAAWFALVPAEAAMVHFFGTTPGKWLMGIRVECTAGGKLPYAWALERAWKAFYIGMGCGIPFLELYCMYKGYKAHTREVDTGWDLDCSAEIVFRKFSWGNVVLALAFYGLLVGADFLSGRDAMLPKYRSNELTVAQFAKNYNMYNELLYDGNMERMGADGVLDTVNYDAYMTLPDYGQLVYNPYAQFEYHLDGGTIDVITYRHTWYEQNWSVDYRVNTGEMSDSMDSWMPLYCRLAMATAISSQAGINYEDMTAYFNQLTEDLARPAADGYTAAYGSVTCTWDLDLDLYVDYEEDSDQVDVYEVTMEWKIEFE